MAAKKGLTALEKSVAKSLFAKNWRSQDIHAWINAGRGSTVNFGRISSVKKDAAQKLASEEEVEFFLLRKNAYDSQTGLNRYDDERLIRAREAMILAVQVFNSAGLKFKTEVFTMLANVAWTYLMHEFYTRRVPINLVKPNGFTFALSELIERQDFPLSEGVRQNLRALKTLRDKVEHHLLGKADQHWLGLFQACCLNFDKALVDLFGPKLTLAGDLAFALHFSKLDLDQAVTVNKYEVPEHIAAIDALITQGMTPEQLNNIEFRFRVIYTLDSSPKSKAHIHFVKPESAEGKLIHNVLTKKVIADDEYPHKPLKVVAEVCKKSGQAFTNNDHSKAWRLYKARPKSKAAQPEYTDKSFCIYHAAHKDYTYSDEWVAKLIAAAKDPQELAKIRAVKMQG